MYTSLRVQPLQRRGLQILMQMLDTVIMLHVLSHVLVLYHVVNGTSTPKATATFRYLHVNDVLVNQSEMPVPEAARILEQTESAQTTTP